MARGDGSEIDVCPLGLCRDATGQAFEDRQAEAATGTAWAAVGVLGLVLGRRGRGFGPQAGPGAAAAPGGAV